MHESRANCLFITGALLLLAGCSSQQVAYDRPSLLHNDHVLHISAAQADQIMLHAIHQGWPDKHPSKIPPPATGYEFQVASGMKHDTISAMAISQGPHAYIFSVTNAGNAPATGEPARDKLLKLLASNARKVIHASAVGPADQAN